MGALSGTCPRGATGRDYLRGVFMGGGCLTGGVVEKVSKNRKLCFIVFCKCWQNTQLESDKRGKQEGRGATASQFWKHSLGNSYGVAKTMFARAISKVAGSEARREGRERDCFI